MGAAVIGIIGGSGVYDLPGLEDMREERITTPWGEPSDALRRRPLHGPRVVFLPRHGRGHRLSPSGINYRANIDALKRAGVTDLVSVSACGSYRAELYPGLFVFVDQFVDRTFARESSFFGKGCVAHVPMAYPVAPLLVAGWSRPPRPRTSPTGKAAPICAWKARPSRRAPNRSPTRSLGYDVVGMTAMPEAKLAREAEICYATVAMVTDFDCWHPGARQRRCGQGHQGGARQCPSGRRAPGPPDPRFPGRPRALPGGSDRALDAAFITAPEARDPDLLRKLDAVAGRVLRGA